MEDETIIPPQDSTKTDVEKRREEYEALKAENDKVEEELLRREKLKAEVRLGGETGGHIHTPTPEEAFKKKAEDMANEIVSAFR